MDKFIEECDYLVWYNGRLREVRPRCVDISTFAANLRDTLDAIVQMRVDAEHNNFLDAEEYIDFEDIMNMMSTMDRKE